MLSQAPLGLSEKNRKRPLTFNHQPLSLSQANLIVEPNCFVSSHGALIIESSIGSGDFVFLVPSRFSQRKDKRIKLWTKALDGIKPPTI
jgi:hypothetical protein